MSAPDPAPGPAPAAGFPSDVFARQRFAVLGLGRNGLAAATALSAMGASVSAWDDTPQARPAAAQAGLDVRIPRMGGHGSARLDALVMSPGIPHRLPAPHPLAATARAAGIPILSDAELLFQAVRACGSRARFAGITGTNGKSTTTALLAHILGQAGVPVAAGGNLGPAALSLPLLPDDGVYVLEMSSYMLERLQTLRFDAACLLNLSPDHLDRHGDMDGYVAAKAQVFARRRADRDAAVVGLDDAASRTVARDLAAASAGGGVLGVSGVARAEAGGCAVWSDGTVLRDRTGAILSLAQAPALPGEHNAQNAAAAAAMALHLGAGRQAVAAGLRSFAGLPHRQRVVAQAAGIRFVDDSKATNADAASRALSCYPRLVWIAGGIAKAGGIEALAPLFGRIAHAELVGQDAALLAQALAQAGVPHAIAGTLERAVPAAWQAARSLGAPVVLLSPACASFDQFSGFEARGLRFAELARALDGGAASGPPEPGASGPGASGPGASDPGPSSPGPSGGPLPGAAPESGPRGAT